MSCCSSLKWKVFSVLLILSSLECGRFFKPLNSFLAVDDVTTSDKNNTNDKDVIHDDDSSSNAAIMNNATTTTATSANKYDKDSEWKRAYEFTLERYKERQRQQSTAENNATTTTSKQDVILYSLVDQRKRLKVGRGAFVHSVRIPKAGSSYLSVTARALAGCLPDGFPCCGWPPKKINGEASCPRAGLTCHNRVRGCTGHQGSFIDRARLNGMPVITAVRHPVDRLVSGFFYGGIHRPKGKNKSWYTFEHLYIKKSKFRNVHCKMLAAGDFAYVQYNETRHTALRAQARLCQRIDWFAVTDALPILSQVLLYEMPFFDNLLPNPVVFNQPALPGRGVEALPLKLQNKTKAGTGLRSQQHNTAYAAFRQLVQTGNGTALVNEYNDQDVQLYNFALALQCARLRHLLPVLREHSLALHEVEVCENLVDQRTEQELCASSQHVVLKEA